MQVLKRFWKFLPEDGWANFSLSVFLVFCSVVGQRRTLGVGNNFPSVGCRSTFEEALIFHISHIDTPANKVCWGIFFI